MASWQVRTVSLFQGVYMCPACVACLLGKVMNVLVLLLPFALASSDCGAVLIIKNPCCSFRKIWGLGANTRWVLRYFREFEVGGHRVLRTKKLILVHYPAGVLKWGWEDWLLLHKDSFDWGFMYKNPYHPTSIKGLLQHYLNTIQMDGSDKEPYHTSSFLKRHTSICLPKL